MTQEEKAKAYDEALKYARIYYTEGNEDMKMMMKTCFPVLIEESMDEKIRKEIISALKFANVKGVYDEHIAWLEKRDKQKLTWSEEDEKVRKALKEAGYEWSEETHDLKKIEQNLAWSEEDEKMIDEIIDYMKPMPIFFESTKGKSGKEYTKEFVKNAINWLKSLKERIGE